jgi:hypothetical protein
VVLLQNVEIKIGTFASFIMADNLLRPADANATLAAPDIISMAEPGMNSYST